MSAGDHLRATRFCTTTGREPPVEPTTPEPAPMPQEGAPIDDRAPTDNARFDRRAIVPALLLVVSAVVAWCFMLLGGVDPFVGQAASTIAVITRGCADVAAVACLGSLVYAVFLCPGECGRLAGRARRARAHAALAASVWSAAGLLRAGASSADQSHPSAATIAWSVTGLLALSIAVGCLFIGTWRWAAWCTALAGLAVLPPLMLGHSAQGAGHDLSTNTIVAHALAAAVWIGVLPQLIAHVRQSPDSSDLVLARYRRLALICWAVLAVSGVVDAVVLIAPLRLLSTGYAAMLAAKVAVLLFLGVLGVLWRRKYSRGDRPAGVVRLLAGELVIMACAPAITASMATTPTPNVITEVSAGEAMIGYELAIPPTPHALLLHWRIDLLFVTLALVAVLSYLLGVRRLRRRGDHWPIGRTSAWLIGWACVVWATSSGVGAYSAGVFSLHMLVHMVLNMLVPVLLVLGGPVTLALRALPPCGRGAPAGPREWLLAALHSPLTRMLAHPGVAAGLFVGSFYALYFTDLFESAMFEYWGHQLMKLHFLLVGYLYYWTVIGIDPTPRTLPHLARLGMILAVMPFHAFFGIITMSMSSVIAENYFEALNLGWATDLAADQYLAGGIAWAAGEAPLIIVLLALLTQWYRHDTRHAARSDRSDDEELAAYNEMLAELARTRRT